MKTIKLQLLFFFCLSLSSGIVSFEEVMAETIKAQNPEAVKNLVDNNSSSDIKVLIDVSGSMKKTDPNNVRSPALRLMVGLLPNDTRTAVYNFGTGVEEIVQPGFTDEAWKEKARAASNVIHSKDLFTNIGQALSTASQEWAPLATENKNNANRNIIILTDGMVDISKDDQVNLQERSRILNEQLAKIKSLQAQIHTVALSEQADMDFLNKLSLQTDGNFIRADKADELERVFLKLFEKTTEPDTVPLIDNKFVIDDSIYELTLLVFKDKNAENQTTEVVEPGGITYKKENRPEYVKWHSEKNYDLITVQKPVVGDWSINAEIDPDNRVMVVTNLKIQTNPMPNNVYLGEILKMNISLSDQKEIISDANFLELTSVSVKNETPDSSTSGKRIFLHDNGLRGDETAEDGIFNLALGKSFILGENEFLIRAEGETFAREMRRSFTIHDIPLLRSHLEIIEGDNKEIKRITVTPNLEYVSAENIRVQAELLSPGGEKESVTLINDNAQQLEWYFETSSIEEHEDYSLKFFMQGQTLRGRPIFYFSKNIKLNIEEVIEKHIQTESRDGNAIKVTVKPAEENKQTIPPPPIVKADEIKKTAEETDVIEETVAEESSDWTSGIIIAVVVNILAVAAGWFFYRRRKNSDDEDLIDFAGEIA